MCLPTMDVVGGAPAREFSCGAGALANAMATLAAAHGRRRACTVHTGGGVQARGSSTR
jgi:hypothetical protein